MFITGVNDTGDKLFSDVNDTGEKFIAGVVDTGEQFIFPQWKKEKERKKENLFSQAQRKQYDNAIYVEHSNIVIIMNSRDFAW